MAITGRSVATQVLIIVRIEQHLMRFLTVGTQDKCSAVCQLEVGHLELHPLATDDRPIYTPVELEGLTWRKRQGHECATTGDSCRFLLPLVPCP